MTTAIARAFTAEERQSYIGASEIAAVCGHDMYRSPLDVYNEKLGLTEPFAGNAHTERGNRLEAIAVEEFTKLTGDVLHRRNKAYTHPQHSFIVGHIDRVFVGKQQLAEVKCPSMGAFRKYQREGLPKSMVMQMQVYLGLTGFPKGTWIIFCADAWDIATFEIDFDKAIYEKAIEKAAAFWTDHVLAKVPPFQADHGEKQEFEIATVGGDATLRDDEAFVSFAAKLREAKQLIADAEELYAMVMADGLALIEETPGIYIGGGLTLHYKEQAGRKSFDKKALAAAYPEIDLSRFEKQGKPFKTFKPYFTN